MKTTLILALFGLTSSMVLAAAPKHIQVKGHYFAGSSYGMYVGRMETDFVNSAKSYCDNLGESLIKITEVKVTMNATFNNFTDSRMDDATPVGQSFTSGLVTCAK